MKSSFPKLSSAQGSLLRIIPSARRELEKLLFCRHPRREWGAFFRFGYHRAPWGLALSFVEMLPPLPGDLDRASGIVSFNPAYISRMLEEREKSPLGIGVIHSHPLATGVWPSPLDDDMDLYYARLFKPYGRERPYASLIFNRNQEGDLVFSGRLFDRDLWLPVETLYTVGDRIERQESSLLLKPKTVRAKGESFVERWENLVGPVVTERFARAKFGIVGCSGTGSPVVEALARAQVGAFVVVDAQRAARSNLERIHGSTRKDVEAPVPPYKVELMWRLIRDINPTAEVTALVGNILDDEVWGELLSCDIVLGCTDTYHGRAALGDLASLYLVAVIDVGVLPKGKNGQVTDQLIEITRMSPVDPCPFCMGRIDPKALSVELMTKEEKDRCRLAAAEAEARGEDGTVYWPGEGPQLPSVGYLTTVAGALAAGYALNWLLGTAAMPHSRFQFDIGRPEFAFTTDTRTQNPECSCARHLGWGDDGERSVTRPSRFSSRVSQKP